ncbi:hypothetical protein niasHT_035072 [Heterodera trifolii]|uniref:Uncharacterized protein n=1 Tax=Heterodera trifolii TaxID=157864 RepID=A0ABD2IED4_9BILA
MYLSYCEGVSVFVPSSASSTSSSVNAHHLHGGSSASSSVLICSAGGAGADVRRARALPILHMVLFYLGSHS